MPLPSLPIEVQSLMAARDYEFHATLDLVLGNGVEVHIATANLTDVSSATFGIVDYVDDLRQSGQVNESVTLAVNRIDLRAQNVDGVLGQVLSSARALNGASGILSIVFIDDSNDMFQVEVLHGEASSAADQDPDITFQLVAHLTTDGPIGGFRTLTNACFNRYKIDIRCGSLSPLAQRCDKTVNGPNGCEAHLAALRNQAAPNNRFSHTGFIYQIRPLPGTPPTGPTGIVDGNDDFNNYWRDRQSLGGYSGRHNIPHYAALP